MNSIFLSLILSLNDDGDDDDDNGDDDDDDRIQVRKGVVGSKLLG